MFAVSGLRFQTLRVDSLRRSEQAFRYAGWSMLYLIGHMMGGAAVGAALGLLGGFLSLPFAAAVLGVLCLYWAFQEAKAVPNGLPQWHRQVPRHWVGRRPWAFVAMGYGLQLGSAVSTRIKTRTTYAALIGAFVAASPATGAVIMLTFGAARALPAIALGPSLASPDQAFRFSARVDALRPTLLRADAATLLLAGLVLAWIGWAQVTGAVAG